MSLNAFPQFPDCMFCCDKGITLDEFNGYRFCTCPGRKARGAGWPRGHRQGKCGAADIGDNVTGDELAARLYAEQGYLVAACDSPRGIGSIGKELTKVPFVDAVVGKRLTYARLTA